MADLGSPRVRVIVVEAKPEYREAASRLLREAGFTVRSFQSAREALMSPPDATPEVFVTGAASVLARVRLGTLVHAFEDEPPPVRAALLALAGETGLRMLFARATGGLDGARFALGASRLAALHPPD